MIRGITSIDCSRFKHCVILTLFSTAVLAGYSVEDGLIQQGTYCVYIYIEMFKGVCRFSKSAKVLKNTTGHLHSGVQLLSTQGFPFQPFPASGGFLEKLHRGAHGGGSGQGCLRCNKGFPYGTWGLKIEVGGVL